MGEEKNKEVPPSEPSKVSGPSGPQNEAKEVKKGAFSRITRTICDKDLTNKAVARLLLDERDGLLAENALLENFRDRYYEAERKASVFEAKSQKEDQFKALYSTALAFGGILLGLWPSANTVVLKGVLAGSGLLLIIISAIISFLWR